MNHERKVIVLEDGEGEQVWFLDHFCTLKVRSKDGAPFGLLEVRLAAGAETPFHRHRKEDEAFYVLAGRMTVFLEGGRSVEMRQGCYVHIPKGVAHGFRVDAELRMLVLSDAAGFVELVREAGVPAPRAELPPPGPPDMPKLEAATKKYSIDLLGPLPS